MPCGFCGGRNAQIQKKFWYFENIKVWQFFKTVNYKLIGQFLMVLSRFSHKNVVYTVVPKITMFFVRIATNPFKIGRF